MTNREKYENYAKEITSKVIEQMSKGVIPWNKPFYKLGGKHNSYNSKESYSPLNQLILDLYLDENDKREYIEYATFNAIKKAGGKVNKGAKAKPLYEMFITVGIKTDKNGEIVKDDDDKAMIYPKYHATKVLVFDVEKDTNLKISKKENKDNKKIEEPEKIISQYIKNSGVILSHDDKSKAYYRPSTDTVNVPPIEQFKNSNLYYSVMFHELTHSTGATKRLNRLIKTAAFGTNEYSKEELVAEIGAYSLANLCNVSTEKTEKNSIAYLQSWIRALQNDTTLFVKAMQQATKAVKYILDEE